MGRAADTAEHAAVLVLVTPLGDRREPDRDRDPSPFPGSSVDHVRRPGRRRSTRRPEPGLGPSHVDRRRHPGGGRASSPPGERSRSIRRSSLGPSCLPFRRARATRCHDDPGWLRQPVAGGARAERRGTEPARRASRRAGSDGGTRDHDRCRRRRVGPGGTGSTSTCSMSGGRPLPAADVIDIPSVEVRVWSDRAVRYDLEPSLDGTGVVVRVTNTGLVAIPAVPDRNSSASRDPDARWCDRSSP